MFTPKSGRFGRKAFRKIDRSKEKNIGRKKRVDYTELCVEKLMNTNETLKKALDDLDSIEKKDGGIRLELSGSLR